MEDTQAKLARLRKEDWSAFSSLSYALVFNKSYKEYVRLLYTASVPLTEEEYAACKLKILITGDLP
jgi:hypothetical protein